MEDKTTTQPDVKPPVEKTKNNTFLTILLTILFFITSGIAIFAVYQNNQLQKQITQLKSPTNQKSSTTTELTPTSNPTEAWVTYTNKQYNLSFKYPSNFIIEENVIPTNNSLQIIINKGQKNTFSVNASANFSSTDATYFLDAEPTGKVIIDGITWKDYYLPTGSSHGTEPIYGLQNQTNEILYTVTFFNQNSINPIQNQILSTFKFINQQQEISTENWKTYNYNKSNFQPNKGPEALGYEYQGSITFKYPPSYQFTETTCRTSYREDKGRFCMNIGGLNLNKNTDLIIVDFLEFYDLKSTEHLQEFNRHEIISEETIEGYEYDVKVLKTKLDLTPQEGFEGRAIIYKVGAGSVGLIFKLRESLEMSMSQLENLEEEILQIMKTVKITP